MRAIPTLDKEDSKIISIPGQVPEPGSYPSWLSFQGTDVWMHQKFVLPNLPKKSYIIRGSTDVIIE